MNAGGGKKEKEETGESGAEKRERERERWRGARGRETRERERKKKEEKRGSGRAAGTQERLGKPGKKHGENESERGAGSSLTYVHTVLVTRGPERRARQKDRSAGRRITSFPSQPLTSGIIFV